jgi:hypothetical protein
MDDKSFELIEKVYSRMEEGFASIHAQMATKEDLCQLEERLIGKIAQLEHSHGQKLDALFDGYTANTEAINTLRSEMKTLETKVEAHEVKLRIVK